VVSADAEAVTLAEMFVANTDVENLLLSVLRAQALLGAAAGNRRADRRVASQHQGGEAGLHARPKRPSLGLGRAGWGEGVRRVGQDAAQDVLVAGDLKAAGGDLSGGEFAREQGEDHLRSAREDEIR